MFWWIFFFVCGLATLFLLWFARLEFGQGRRWVREGDEKPYVELAKTTITSSGIGIAILVFALRSDNALPREWVRYATSSFVVCIVSSLVFALVEVVANQNALANVDRGEQGELTTWEMALMYVSGGLALESFLVGFLFLGRIVFVL